MNKGKNRKIRFEQVYDVDSILDAESEARKGKGMKYGTRKFERDTYGNCLKIQQQLKDRTYRTPKPNLEERHCEHKTRVLAKVHFYDHVAHHALMRVIMPVLERSYYYESAASIKGRGIHYSMKHVRKYIDLHKDKPLWWAQLDFKKFYHNINRQKLYDKLCKTFADEGIRWMLHDIIWSLGNHNGLEETDGTTGLGIGLYPVQPLANFYLNDFDREVARMEGVKMFRYCDNVLLIGDSPDALWKAISFIRDYTKNVLEQPLHENVGVQRLDDVHPVDYVGYLFYPDFTFVRKRLKYTFKRKIKRCSEDKKREVLSSYKGWLEHADGLTLWQKVTGMRRFSDLNITRSETMMNGQRYFDVPTVSASFLVNREIVVKDFIENVETKNGKDRMCILIEENGGEKKFLTNNPRIKDIMMQVRELDELPFSATLRSRNINGNKIDYYFE